MSQFFKLVSNGRDKILIAYMSGGSPSTYWLTYNTSGDTYSAVSAAESFPICDMVYDTARTRVVAYGTCNAMGSAKGEAYEFISGSWTAVSTEHHGLGDYIAYDSFRQRVVTFGDGYLSSAVPGNETWEYSGTDWNQLFPQTTPKKRNSCQITYDSLHRRTIIFGGTDAFSSTLSDMWEYKY